MKTSVLKLIVVAGVGLGLSLLAGCTTESNYQGTQRIYPAQWEWGQGAQTDYRHPSQWEWGAKTAPTSTPAATHPAT